MFHEKFKTLKINILKIESMDCYIYLNMVFLIRITLIYIYIFLRFKLLKGIIINKFLIKKKLFTSSIFIINNAYKCKLTLTI